MCPRPPVLTEDVDKDFVQVERQQRFFESLEVVPHCPEDVPLKAGVQLLPAVTAIRPWGEGGSCDFQNGTIPEG